MSNRALVAAAAVAVVASDSFVVVNTTLGAVRGVKRVNSVDFTGIRFASAPVGPLRWRDPQPMTPWNGIYDATQPAPGCPQVCSSPAPSVDCPLVQSEDCLMLNVFMPITATPESNLPCLVWFYGGNFHEGWSGAQLYNGSMMASRGNIIVITANYRVGALGFLYSDAAGIGGNFGLKDQAQSMKWIKQNIAAFGGNPNLITISGQSAGAQSSYCHAAIPSSEGLFSRIIAQSNPLALITRNVTQGNQAATAFSAALGCAPDDTACLWGANSTAVLQAQFATEANISAYEPFFLLRFEVWTPVSGTQYMPLAPLDAWQAGAIHPGLDVLSGRTANEGVSYAYGALPGNYSPPIETILAGILLYGLDNIPEILEQYPIPANEATDSRPTAAVIVTDSLWRCPLRNASIHASAAGHRAYFYDFDHPASFGEQIWNSVGDWYCVNMVREDNIACAHPDKTQFTGQDLRVQTCHGGDIPFVFHPDLALINATYTPAEETFTQILEEYWSSFVATGIPVSKTSNVPVWPEFGASGASLVLQTGSIVQLDGSQDAAVCALWDRIGYHLP